MTKESRKKTNKDEMIKESIKLMKEPEVNHAFFGVPKITEPMGSIETNDPFEHSPKMVGVTLLKTGFFYKRPMLLTEAYFEHCYKSGNSLFTVNLVEGETNTQRRMSFILTEAEELQMKEFVSKNKIPFELEFTIRLGVPMNGKK